MRIEPIIVELWVSCLACRQAMGLGSWHVHDQVMPLRTSGDGVPVSALGFDAALLPMDRGLANALEIAIEAFAASHNRDGLRLVDARPVGFAIEEEPEPTTLDISGARSRVTDPEHGRDAETRVAFAIHRLTRDPDQRAIRLEDLACEGFARETLAGNRNARHYAGWLRAETEVDHLHVRAIEITRSQGRIREALELMRRFFVEPEAVAALADDVADALADATTPPAQREGVFRLARFLIPDAIDAAFRKGRLPDVPVPASWDALRAHPLGRELLSLSVSNESLERAITRGDQQQLGIALKLLVDRARLHPEVAGAAEPWLRPLLTDERPLPRGGVVATLAEPLYRAALGALENKRVRELLPVAIARSLAPVHGVSPGFWSYYDDASRIHVRKSTILKVLLELLGDPEVLPAIRVRAREVLDRGPADQAVVEARRDANDIVLQILRDPHESAEVRDAMRSQLSVWMPKRISELRGNVIKRVSSLPNLDELRRDHGERLDANLRELSLQTELSQIERLVAQGRPDERDQIATALELVPHVVTWREDALSSLEAAVRTRLDDASWPEPSRVAAIYSRLLLDIAESGSGMPDLEDVLDVVSNLSADSLEPATWIDLLDRLGEVYAEDRVPSWLTLRATDPQTAAPVRFAAFKALCRRTGLAPELRAGIGISAAAAETDLTERARIVGLLCNAHPKLAIQAAEAGRLPAIHLPDIAWLYHAWDDGPADRRPGRVDVASRLVPPSEVIDALRAADRLDHTLAALELVPVAIEAEPELRADAIEALFRRLSDNRYVSAPSSNHRWHVMPTALDRYLDLVREDPTRTERALLAILDRTETAQFAVRCFRRGIRDHWIQMMGSLFDAAVGPHETPARRLGAWIALAEAGASQHEAAAQLAAAATRVTPALRGLLREAETPAEVRAEARKHPRARALL